MKSRTHYFYWLLVLMLGSALACSAGGSTGGAAPTPTLISLPQTSDDGGMVATEPPATEESVASGGTVPICSLLTNDEAAAVLGGPVTSAPREGGEPGRKFTNCEYGSGSVSLTLQGGSAEQAKQLLMAAAWNMQAMKADPAEQQVIDDTMANLPGLSLQEVANRIFPQYATHCFTSTDLTGVGDFGRLITCPALHYVAVTARRGQSDPEIAFLDIVLINSSLSEADQQAKLITAVNTALSRLPSGATTVVGN